MAVAAALVVEGSLAVEFLDIATGGPAATAAVLFVLVLGTCRIAAA
jgi:hypothetical protein